MFTLLHIQSHLPRPPYVSEAYTCRSSRMKPSRKQIMEEKLQWSIYDIIMEDLTLAS